jgi:putative exporter of polyketide antibiotics
LLPVEKKLIGWSLGIGVVLLILLAIVNQMFPASI